MDIDYQNKKTELIQWISTLSDESIIEEIMMLRESERNTRREEISKEEKKSLDQGIKDADAGKLRSHSEAKKVYEKWL